MKKLTSLLLAIIMLSSCFTFVGCIDLSDDTKMKEAYLRQFGIKDVKAEDVVIDYDAGTYNGARVVMLDAEWHDTAPKLIESYGQKHMDYNTMEWSEIIDGIEFHYYDTNRLRLFKYGVFYTLKQAKILGLISDKNIKDIAIRFKEKVNHFRDTCDIFDFPEQFRFENYNGAYDDVESYDDEIIVEIDSRISRGTSIMDGTSRVDLIEYIGYESISSIKKTSKYSPTSDYFYVKLKSPGKENITSLIEYLSKVPGILSAGYSLKIGGRPEQAANGDYENSDLWEIAFINVEKVWDFAKGSKSVRVGIIDTGVALHSDLEGNLCDGYDVHNNDAATYDGDTEHGTFISGIIACKGNNDMGICGVNQIVSIIPLQALDSDSGYYNANCPASLCTAAINYATNHYIDIINFSLGGYDNDEEMELMKQKIAEYPGLFICSAGNANLDVDENPEYPDYYGSSNLGKDELENIIVVGGLDRNGSRYYSSSNDGSNYGANTVDIYAPGYEVFSTYPENYYSNSPLMPPGYDIKSGTSFAAPYVSGVAALLLSIEPDLTAEQLKECIIGGADSITIMVGENNNESQSAKKLNAWGAFKYLMDNYYTFDTDEIYSIGTSSIQFNDEIQSTNDYSTFKTNTLFIKINIQTTGHYNFAAIADNDIKIGLYDSSYELITERSTYATSQASADFLCYLQPGTYYLKTNFLEEITGDGEIDFTVNYTQEDHQATSYLLYSSTHHRCVCECGELVSISPHTVKLSEVILGIGHCMYCGARVMLDDTIVQVPGINNVSQVTANGSYILPNGIIVLVDEDIEAYLNGTLVFYDKDDLPMVQ